MRGAFILDGIRHWNNITDQGESSFLKMLFRGDDTIVAAGDPFYIGLMADIDLGAIEAATLADIDEPTSTGGYARQGANRNLTDWPTLEQINGVWRIVSKQVTFTASGANFSRAIRRAFLTDVETGTDGNIFAISGPLETDRQITDGQSFPTQYEFYMD